MSARIDYRPIDMNVDGDRAVSILHQAFGGTPEWMRTVLLIAGPADMRVVGAPGAPIDATLRFIQWGQFFGGLRVPMTGIAGVAVAPEARGRGLATGIMTSALREMHSAGVPISVLYPATQELYRRVGYEQAGSSFEASLDLRALDVLPGARAATLRAVNDDDMPRIEASYLRHAPYTNGAIDRAGFAWPRITRPRGERASGYLIEEHGEIAGWVFLLRTEGSAGSNPAVTTRLLACTDLKAWTPAAARTLLDFLVDHSTIQSTATFGIGPHNPFLSIIAEQRMTVKLIDYWMLRVVNVPAALESRGYTRGLSGRVVFEVRDELLPDNADVFALEVESGRGSVTRGGSAEGAIRLDIRDLAALYTGFMSARDAAVLGRLSGPEDALDAATALFAAAHPSIDHRF